MVESPTPEHPFPAPPAAGIVDSHVHLLPGRLGLKVRSIFADLGGYSLAYPADHAAICEQLANEGVVEVWTLPYSHKPGAAESLNEAAQASAAQDYAVRVIAGATVHPGDDDPGAVVRRAVEDGGARVLKLHCSVGDFDPTDPGLEGVWDYAEQIRLPVVVHAGRAVSGLSELDDLTPMGEVAARHPEARLIIAHCGHHAVSDALDLLDRHNQLLADLTPVVDQFVDLPPARAQALSGRLLFGTDAPNTEFTSTQCRAHVDSLGLSDAERAAVLGGNARRLIADVLV